MMARKVGRRAFRAGWRVWQLDTEKPQDEWTAIGPTFTTRQKARAFLKLSKRFAAELEKSKPVDKPEAPICTLPEVIKP